MAQKNTPQELLSFWESNGIAGTSWRTAVKGKEQLDAREYEQHHAALTSGSKAMCACPCRGCGTTTKRRVDAIRHLAATHCAWYRHLQCPQCAFTSKEKSALQSHVNNIHANVRRYGCPVRTCTEAFKDDGALSAHKRRAHSAEELAADDAPKNARSAAARKREARKAESRTEEPQPAVEAQNAATPPPPAMPEENLLALQQYLGAPWSLPRTTSHSRFQTPVRQEAQLLLPTPAWMPEPNATAKAGEEMLEREARTKPVDGLRQRTESPELAAPLLMDQAEALSGPGRQFHLEEPSLDFETWSGAQMWDQNDELAGFDWLNEELGLDPLALTRGWGEDFFTHVQA